MKGTKVRTSLQFLSYSKLFINPVNNVNELHMIKDTCIYITIYIYMYVCMYVYNIIIYSL